MGEARDADETPTRMVNAMRRYLWTLAALLAATGAPAGEDVRPKPLARWSFEHGTDEWHAHGAPARWSKLKAKDGGWSLKLDVAFPRPASVWRSVNVDMDVVGRVAYHVYVPTDAPGDIKTLLFLKDKDGLWFQHFCEASLRPGGWNTVTVDIGPKSPYLRPSGHHRLWSTVAARKMNQIGVKFFCDDEFTGSLHLDRVLAYPVVEAPARLRVLNLRENALEVGRYEKFEVTFDLSRHVTNPFDPEQIAVDATFLDPHGKAITVPGFYYQGFVRRLTNDREELVPVGAGCWKVRFAPVSVGTHSYYISARLTPDRESHGQPEQLITGKRAFECVPSGSRGFVGVSKRDPFYFEFSNGEWFYPIGHNIHSPSDDTPRAVNIQRAVKADILPPHGTFTYDYLFRKMAANGENFAEVWMCTWWMAIEWIKDWKHYRGLTDFNLQNAWKLDYTVGLAEKHNMYLHVVIDNHGKASTWTDPEWEDNPYNKINGGFLASPEEFFRNPVAKSIYRKKLRYIIARWGYTTRLAGLELWSEVDLVGDSWSFHSSDVHAAPKVQWHREMTQYLDQLDPWGHICTTHFSTNYARIKSTLVTIRGIHYITTDAYRGSSKPITGYVVATANAGNNYGKPVIVTEYGGSPFGSSIPGLRSDLHAGIWSSYMTHTAGTPLLWWHQFIDADNQYWNFKALAAYHAGEDRRGKGFARGTVTFLGTTGDLAAMALQTTREVYAWVYSAAAASRMPSRSSARAYRGVTARLRGLADGAYRVEVWDTHKGTVVATLEAKAENGRLAVPLPEFRIDCALKVKPAP